MKTVRRTGFAGGLLLAVAGLLLPPALMAQTKPADLDAILHQMDEGSAKFKSAQADLKKDLYERVVKETTTQAGSVYYQRVGTSIQMGAKFISPSRTIEIKDGAIRLFEPGTNHLTEISIKNNQAQYESFLTLGFGGSGKDLASKWSINFMGMENLNDGKKSVPVAKLDLAAKDANTRNTFTHILIWIDPAQDVSLKQQFFQPSGDNQTVTFSNIRTNQLKKADIDIFAIKTDKKTSLDRR